MKKLLIISLILSYSVKARADIFLATHLLLSGLATKYIPDYAANTSYGPYAGVTYGFRYEVGDSYKTGDDTEGSEKQSPGIVLGYHFLNADSHKLAITYDRKWAKFQTEDEVEGTNTIDSFGLRFNYKILAFKVGWSSHAFDNDDNKHDGGTFTGVGIDLYWGKFSIFMDITDHYLEDRKKHIAGGDLGVRWSFGSQAGGQ